MSLAEPMPRVFLPGRWPCASSAGQSVCGEPGRDARRFIEQYAFEHGRTYDSYLMIEDDRDYFWSGGGRAVIGYVNWGRFLHVTGTLTAPADCSDDLLADFLTFSRLKGYGVCIYNIFDEDIPLYERHGFQVTKWGEEPVVDLRGATWEGKPYEWVRRQENY